MLIGAKIDVNWGIFWLEITVKILQTDNLKLELITTTHHPKES